MLATKECRFQCALAIILTLIFAFSQIAAGERIVVDMDEECFRPLQASVGGDERMDVTEFLSFVKDRETTGPSIQENKYEDTFNFLAGELCKEVFGEDSVCDDNALLISPDKIDGNDPVLERKEDIFVYKICEETVKAISNPDLPTPAPSATQAPSPSPNQAPLPVNVIKDEHIVDVCNTGFNSGFEEALQKWWEEYVQQEFEKKDVIFRSADVTDLDDLVDKSNGKSCYKKAKFSYEGVAAEGLTRANLGFRGSFDSILAECKEIIKDDETFTICFEDGGSSFSGLGIGLAAGFLGVQFVFCLLCRKRYTKNRALNFSVPSLPSDDEDEFNIAETGNE